MSGPPTPLFLLVYTASAGLDEPLTKAGHGRDVAVCAGSPNSRIAAPPLRGRLLVSEGTRSETEPVYTGPVVLRIHRCFQHGSINM